MREKKNLILILAIAILFMAGGYVALAKKLPKTGTLPTAKTSANITTSSGLVPPTIPPGSTLQYQNDQYGFRISLPESWKGYLIVTDIWKGMSNGEEGEAVVEKGPLISIRHPLWTPQKPRQDIPIMVFTTSQWNSLQALRYHIGAAPVNPTELGHNSKYVFALPARYNYAFLEGYEEVERIIQGKSLQAF